MQQRKKMRMHKTRRKRQRIMDNEHCKTQRGKREKKNKQQGRSRKITLHASSDLNSWCDVKQRTQTPKMH